MKQFPTIIRWLQANQASWPSLDFDEWPTGLRHDLSWHCTKRALHVAQEMDQEAKQGSWYALAAKRQWIAGKITKQAMQNSIKMAQLSMIPEEIETGRGWFQQERTKYENILTGIQEDLSPQERAWIEADTAKYIAQDALARITWATIQIDPPDLPDIIRMFHRAIRNLTAAKSWLDNAQRDWHSTQHDWHTLEILVRKQVRSQVEQEESWQKEKLLHLLTLHQQYRERICDWLKEFAQNRERLQKQWHSEWEDALFSS